jgi:hypothetical protein
MTIFRQGPEIVQQGIVAANPCADVTEVLRKMTSNGQEGGYQLGAAVDPSLNDIGGKIL